MEAALEKWVGSFFSKDIEDKARLSIEAHVEQSLRTLAKNAGLFFLAGLNSFCGVGLKNLFDVLSLGGCFFLKFFFLLFPKLFDSFLFSLAAFFARR